MWDGVHTPLHSADAVKGNNYRYEGASKPGISGTVLLSGCLPAGLRAAHLVRKFTIHIHPTPNKPCVIYKGTAQFVYL